MSALQYKNKRGERGFFQAIALVIAGILLLAYFDVDLRGILSRERLPEWAISTLDFLKNVWRGYLEPRLQSLRELLENR